MNPAFVPQVQVFENFSATPAAVTQPLRACIVGPAAQLVRFGILSERANGRLGAYNPSLDTAYGWPNLVPGGLVDLAYAQLWCADAKLAFFRDAVGEGQVVAAVSGHPNRIAIDGTDGFAATAGVSRLAGLYGRDVRAGDRVRVSAAVSSVIYTADTYVTGFLGDAVAAVVAAASADAGNAATQVESHVTTQVAGTVNCNDVAADLTTYNGLVDGAIAEVYTVTVLQASTGNDVTTAILSLASASGLDDVAQFSPAAVDTLRAVGTRGLQLKVTQSAGPCNLLIGQAWQVAADQAFAATVATSGGTYSGKSDDTYIVTVTRGGFLADASPAKRPQWTITTARGTDAGGPSTITTAHVELPIGTKGLTLELADGTVALCKGDRFYVAATAATTGRVGTLVLADNLPTALQTAADLDLALYVQQDVRVDRDKQGSDPLLNWTADATSLTATAGITLWVAGFADDAGAPIQLALLAGTLYAQYRAWDPAPAAELHGTSDPTAVATAIGVVDPDNPLAFGVGQALANANGTEVKYVAVADPADPTSWAASLHVLVGRQDVYNIVPLSYDPAVLTLVQALAESESTPEKGRKRGMFCGILPTLAAQRVGQATSADNAAVLATLAADASVSGTTYTLLTIASGNATLLDAGVRPGDTVRFFFSTSFGRSTYRTFTVASVVSQSTLKLATSAGAAVATPSLVEVWHANTTDEQIADLIAQAGNFSSTRACAVWSDIFGRGPTPRVAMYYLAAALAGERSGSPPHQSLSSVSLAGFDGYVAPGGALTGDQVGTLCANGVWVVTRTTTIQSNAVITRLGTTTRADTIEFREEMIRVNSDSITMFIQTDLLPYLTGTNLVGSAISVIRIQLDRAHSFLQSSGRTDRLGGQLVDYTLNSIGPHAYLKDTLVVDVTWVLPAPLNQIIVTANIVLGTGVTSVTPVG